MPLSVFRTWPVRDRLAAQALTRLEASLCNGCGQPKHKAWHPDQEGWYDVEALTCAGCAALEEDRRQQGKESSAARKAYVVDTRDYAADPLPPWPEDPADA